jgi:hypothetical protein
MMKTSHFVGLMGTVLAVTLGGCMPMAAPIPFQTMQRAEALPDGAHSTAVAVGAGVGGVNWPVLAAGGAAQYRVGIGDDKELSISGQAIAHKCDGCKEGYQDTHIGIAGRVGIKKSWERTALLAGLGMSGYPGGRAVGVDAGVIHDLFRHMYVSLRAGVSTPVEQQSEFPNDALVPRTEYGMAAIGWHGDMVFAEMGAGAIVAGDHSGSAMYFLVGVDLLKL